MTTALARLSRWADRLADSYTPRALYLAIIRILFAFHVLLFPADYEWVGSVPSAFYAPPKGIASVFSTQPDMELLIVLEAVRTVLALLVLFGLKTKTCSVLLGILLILGSSFTHSYSKVDHFILYELLPIFMAFAGWGLRLSVDSRKQRREAGYGLPVMLWALTIGFALLTAAIPKAISGWLDPERLASRGFIARDIADGYKTGPLGDYLLSIDSIMFWKFTDYATIIAEAIVVVAVISPMLFRLSILAILFFHLGVYLSMDIDFFHYLFVYAIFLTLPQVRLSHLKNRLVHLHTKNYSRRSTADGTPIAR